MGNDRLTRQELSWLLAQEARGAAKALREGVSALSQPPPPLNITIKEGDNVESTLDALDDAITLLSDLQQAPSRRGRIDLAALLCEVSPEARIAMSPGAGTEVFGDEAGLRRMLQVLVTQGHTASAGGTPDLSIRRSGSWIHVGVELGPDTAATVGTEYRWLSRMALRHGGRLELEGGMQWLILPADASAEEMTELRKELEQAQQLGEAYARELAAVFAAGDLPKISPTQAPANEQLGFLVALSTALVRPLREVLGGIREGLQESDAKHREAERNLGLYVSAGYELIGELSRVSELALEEHREAVDLVSLAKAAVQAAEARASRHGVKLELVAPEALSVKQRPSGVELVVRSLLDHAIAATPRSGSVKLTLEARGTGARISVEDGGPTIPSSAFDQLIAGRIDPTSVGRPAGLWLLVAECVSGAIGTEIRIAESANFSVEFDLLPPPS
ncbi:MAG: ATP-binding protein [Polyangiaceae bacterium]